MAIKAMAQFQYLDPNADGFDFHVRVMAPSNYIDAVIETELVMSATATQMNNVMIDGARAVAENQLEVTFGLLDTLHFLNPIDTLLG